MNQALLDRLRSIRLLAMDVDGVLTTGGIGLAEGPGGEPLELKTFHVRDGLGLSLARAVGLEVAWITGRVSRIVERRAAELKVAHLVQWARNKRTALTETMTAAGVGADETLYLGDDLNDLPAFAVAGVRVAVADADEQVRQQADWVTRQPGGRGAVREVVEAVLRAQGRYEEAVTAFLERLEGEHGRPPGTGAAQ